jgi:hypothetical protein
MDTKLIKIEEDIIIGGFSIETVFENNDKDLEILYNDFTHNGKIQLLNNITKNEQEYYLVTWLTKPDEGKYKYLLGQKINEKLDKLETKVIKSGEYVFSKFPSNYNTLNAWTEMYEEGTRGMGYKGKDVDDIAFKLYPNGLKADYELWILVEKV